ncbi:CPBP family intramembrane glutamic endopeptidase [Serinibacter arcticus]|uniref:CPBP family intramembrane glutamic endopeptidase n=1 Tax=Serinibacter arcticus TaxID=1655435 RepID=UPI001304E1E2|nr:CPBP family intramembrane glutamic endopeptidase [Serinibacter arcticus]
MTYLLGRDDPVHRLRPSLASGLAAVLVAAGLVLTLQLGSGIPLRAWSSSERAIVLTEILPAAVAAVVLLAFVGWARWDAVRRDPFRLPTSPFVLAVVALASLAVLARLALADWGAPTARVLALLALSAAVTGVAEELALRGVLLRSLRVGRRPEIVAALGTTAASAVLQVPVLAFTARGFGPVDVAVAVALGALLYLVRRATRTLVAAVALHLAWDLGTLVDRAGDGAALTGPAAVVAVVVVALVTWAFVATARGDRTRRALVDPRLA